MPVLLDYWYLTAYTLPHTYSNFLSISIFGFSLPPEVIMSMEENLTRALRKKFDYFKENLR